MPVLSIAQQRRQYLMIVQKPIQVWKTSSSSRVNRNKMKQNTSIELKTYYSVADCAQKRKSMPLMNSKTMKSRLSEILKEDELRRSDNSMYQIMKQKKQKNVREYFHKTFLKHKARKSESFSLNSGKEKMSIIGTDEMRDTNRQPSFQIKEIIERRKGSLHPPKAPQYERPFIIPDPYERVIALAKTRFSNERFFVRKPEIPKRLNDKKVGDNFLRPRQLKQKGEDVQFEGLEPWEKSEELEQGIFDI